MGDYIYNLKKFFRFSTDELISMLLIILIYGFILGFNDGYDEFRAARWLYNLLVSILMVAIVIMTHEVGRKMMAIKIGYTVEFKPWWLLIIVSCLIAYFSDGIAEILLPATGMFITHHEKLRIGKFRYGQNYFDNAYIAFMGCYANILMALFLKAFSFLPNQFLIIRLMQFNIIYALLNLIPFDIVFVLWRLEKADIRKHWPPMDGTYIFFASRIFFFFTLGAIVLTSSFLWYMSIIWSVLLGMIMGILVSIVYGIMKENILGG